MKDVHIYKSLRLCLDPALVHLVNVLRCEGGTWKVMDKSDELKLLDCHIGYRLRLFILYHLFAIPEALPVRNAESLQTALGIYFRSLSFSFLEV